MTTNPAARRTPVVLVVDPEPQLRELVIETLRDVGVEAFGAHDGAEARPLFAARRFDLAFIEMMLPGEPGESLAAHGTGIGVETVLMSGHPDAITRAQSASRPFLRKPFRRHQLLAMVIDRLGTWA